MLAIQRIREHVCAGGGGACRPSRRISEHVSILGRVQAGFLYPIPSRPSSYRPSPCPLALPRHGSLLAET